VVPLFALLVVVLMGMLAFSIDLGWIALVKTDLQVTADAAALAGAEQLQQLYVQYFSPGQTNQQAILATASTNTGAANCPMFAAEQVAARNKAGNVSIQVRDQDVTFSFNNGNGDFDQNYQAHGGFPNSVTVTTRRDSTLNSPVSLFFGPIFGWSNKELQATATATIFSGDVTSLQVVQGGSVGPHILPIALDFNIWTKFYTSGGVSPDGNVHLGPNGSPQLYVYALGPWDPAGGTKTPGSFGLIDTGVPATSTPAFRNWITNGETPNDINYLLNQGLLPVSTSSPKQWTVGPGVESTLVSNFDGQMGNPNLIPLFVPYNVPTQGPGYAPWLNGFIAEYYNLTTQYAAGMSGGSNATYGVVGFAAVTISQADASGSNMSISIQPMALVDPTAVISNPTPAGTQVSQFGSTINGPTITTFTSARLTR
jgi:Flp pilus assembly protein TadG